MAVEGRRAARHRDRLSERDARASNLAIANSFEHHARNLEAVAVKFNYGGVLQCARRPTNPRLPHAFGPEPGVLCGIGDLHKGGGSERVTGSVCLRSGFMSCQMARSRREPGSTRQAFL